jgi:hypothetical protein
MVLMLLKTPVAAVAPVVLMIVVLPEAVVPVVPVSSLSLILHKYLKNYNVLQRKRTYIRKLLETG